MARSLSVRGSARKLALTGAALATAGGTLTLCTGVLASTTVAGAQQSSTEPSITVVVN